MKTLIHWIVSALAIAVTAYLLPGAHVDGAVAAFVLAIVLGLINTIIRPVLLLLTLPLSIMTLGLFSLVLNALLILLAARIVPGFSIDGFFSAFLFGIVLALVNFVLHKFEKKD
ncbi:MAG: phage holin family protein [Patescibacteria group bacterium]